MQALLIGLALVVTAPVRPPIVSKPIPYGAARKAEMAAYAQRHYGIDTWRLARPARDRRALHGVDHVLVRVRDVRGRRRRLRARTSFPGTCAHFVVDRDGTIYQLVPLTTMCRHTVGLNYTAIGIEHVGTSDAGILDNPRQIAASLRLTVWLMHRFGIQLRNVIGHNESLTSPYHRERYAPWRCQTHGDWTHARHGRLPAPPGRPRPSLACSPRPARAGGAPRDADGPPDAHGDVQGTLHSPYMSIRPFTSRAGDTEDRRCDVLPLMIGVLALVAPAAAGLDRRTG